MDDINRQGGFAGVSDESSSTVQKSFTESQESNQAKLNCDSSQYHFNNVEGYLVQSGLYLRYINYR